MKTDLEVLLNNFGQVAKDDLNTNISAIDSEKGDFTLKTIADNAYFDQLDNRVINYDPFVYYGINNIETTAHTGAAAYDLTLFIMVCFENLEDPNAYKKALRYGRALQDTYKNVFKKFRNVSQLQIVQATPLDTKLNDGGFYKIGGILVNFVLFD